MAGYIVFDPDNTAVGLTTGDDVAVGIFLDILTDTLYYTDGSEIFEWEGNIGGENPIALKTFVWKSAKHRFPKLVNLGAALVEAESYDDLTFKLYADGTLKFTKTVTNGKPFRLPGGYLSNIYQVQLSGTDTVTGVSIAETIFDLAAG